MPIYEYQCLNCKSLFQRLMLTKDELEMISCPHCHSTDLKRLISRVIFHTKESDRIREYDPMARKDDAFFKDTRNIGLHAKKRAMEMGVDLGESFEAKLDRLRTDPKSVLDEA